MKERNYGLDLLRMISMFMIVTLHVLAQGGAMIKMSGYMNTYYACWFLETCAYCAVNCYGLLSGYVGIDSRFRFSRILYLWMQVFFYSAGITLLYVLIAPGLLEEGIVWKAILPVSWKTYWYFSAYVGVFFLSPFLNKMVYALSERERKKLILILVVIFSIGTAVPKANSVDFLQLVNGYSFVWLMVLYLIGACIRTCSWGHQKRWRWLLIYFASVTFSWSFKIMMESYTKRILGEAKFGRIFTSYTAPTILLCAIALLFICKDLPIRSNRIKKLIAFGSPLSFSVYLIHTHPQIWAYPLKGAFSSYRYLAPWQVIPAVLGTVLLIYLICSFIDFIRLQIFRILHIKELTETLAELMKKLYRKI